MSESHDELLERGRREGGIDARLDEHSRHLATVNGSIERSAIALESVAKEVRDLAVKFDTQIETARATAAALAAETERRRQALVEMASTSDRTFSKRERIVGLLVSLGAFVLAIFLATH